jgi:hypothetical protein
LVKQFFVQWNEYFHWQVFSRFWTQVVGSVPRAGVFPAEDLWLSGDMPALLELPLLLVSRIGMLEREYF